MKSYTHYQRYQIVLEALAYMMIQSHDGHICFTFLRCVFLANILLRRVINITAWAPNSVKIQNSKYRNLDLPVLGEEETLLGTWGRGFPSCRQQKQNGVSRRGRGKGFRSFWPVPRRTRRIDAKGKMQTCRRWKERKIYRGVLGSKWHVLLTAFPLPAPSWGDVGGNGGEIRER